MQRGARPLDVLIHVGAVLHQRLDALRVTCKRKVEAFVTISSRALEVTCFEFFFLHPPLQVLREIFYFA